MFQSQALHTQSTGTSAARRCIALSALFLALAACSSKTPPTSTSTPPAPVPVQPHFDPTPPAPPLPSEDPAAPIPERIARALIAIAPPADPAGIPARDHVADQLRTYSTLLNACEDRVFFGAVEPGGSIDPYEHKSLALAPLALARLYLPLFTFTGPHDIQPRDEDVVLRIPVSFRSNLPLSEYPHAINHSTESWNTYTGAQALLFVFYRDRLGAVYMEKPPTPAAALPPSGTPQSRTSDFAYFFSPTNPNIAPLNASYSTLRAALAAQGCLACHNPANTGNARSLILLGEPAHSLAAHHAIQAVLRANSMPPADHAHNRPRGLRDDAARMHLIQLADDFESTADAALLFESDARGVPRRPIPARRIRPEDKPAPE